MHAAAPIPKNQFPPLPSWIWVKKSPWLSQEPLEENRYNETALRGASQTFLNIRKSPIWLAVCKTKPVFVPIILSIQHDVKPNWELNNYMTGAQKIFHEIQNIPCKFSACQHQAAAPGLLSPILGGFGPLPGGRRKDQRSLLYLTLSRVAPPRQQPHHGGIGHCRPSGAVCVGTRGGWHQPQGRQPEEIQALLISVEKTQ